MTKLHKNKASWQAHPIASKEWIQRKAEERRQSNFSEQEYREGYRIFLARTT